MATIQFETGQKVNFDGNPTPQDVEEVANKLGINKPVQSTAKPIQNANTTPQGTQYKSPQENLFNMGKGIVNALTDSEKNLGQDIGRGLMGGDKYFQGIQDKYNNNVKTLTDLASKQSDPSVKQKYLDMAKSNYDEGQKVGVDFKGRSWEQIAGDVGGTALDVVPLGIEATAGIKSLSGLGKGLSLAERIKEAGKGLSTGQKILKGAVTGAKVGGLYGLTGGLKDNKNTTGVVGSGILGSGTGALLGAGTEGAIEGVKGLRSIQAQKIAQKAEQSDLLEKAIPDARIADKRLEGGKVITDQASKQAVKQGVEPADVALIRSGSEADRSKMSKMIDIRESQLTNKRVTDRATDVVGDSFLDRAKYIEKTNKTASQNLNKVATDLSGQKVDPTSAIDNFSKKLNDSGVKIKSDGSLKFKGSDFEGLHGTQSLINNTWDRAQSLLKNGDALAMHRAKSFIDEQVNYGKSVEGLSGKAQNILKGFRHDIDGILDSNFPEYNKVNTVYADTKGELDKLGQAMGRNFKLNGSFADSRAGITMRRILSNTQGRSGILQLLDSMQKTAQKYGMKINDDIITQANFADVLEKTLGSEAPTSFLGQVERGISGTEKALSAGADFLEGHPVRGAIKGAKTVIDSARGISQKGKIEALRNLLKSTVSSLNK